MEKTFDEKIHSWFSNKTGKLQCPACNKKGHFKFEQSVVVLPQEDESHTGISRTNGKPMIVAICHNCAHIMLFSSQIMGIT